MKKLLICSLFTVLSAPSFAADLPVKAAALAPIAYDPWTGPYIGINIGYGWDLGDASGAFEAVPLGTLQAAPQGVVGGLHVGYGQRFGSIFYAGLEGDIDIANLQGTASMPLITATSKNSWLGSIGARFGVIPIGHAMFYGYAGYGFGGGEFTVNDLLANTAATAKPTLSGFAWGGGIEVPLSAGWLARVEYRQYDFGSVSVTTPSLTAFTMKDRVDTVRGGLTYKF